MGRRASTHVHRGEGPVVVAGAGPQGLAVVLHLLEADPSLRDRLVVVDPSGAWLQRWQAQFAALGIGRLRSPLVHHCDVEPMTLSAFTQRRERHPELFAPYGSPSSSLFLDFSAQLIEDAGIGDVVQPTSLRAVRPDGARLHVELADGTQLDARAVVIATNPGHPRCPRWAIDHPRIRHTATLTALDAAPGARWVVVGGGLSAAHVAVGAAERGAAVTLVARRALRTSEFDTDPGWLGPKYLDAFEAEPSWTHRLEMVLAARDGGSVPPWMLDALRARVTEGSLELVEERSVVAAEPGEPVRLDLDDGRCLVADQVVLATGTRPDISADVALAPLVTADNALPEGIPVLGADLSWCHPALFVMGRLAVLQLGPTAGNLSGARFGARRVTVALAGHRPRPSRRPHRVADRLLPVPPQRSLR